MPESMGSEMQPMLPQPPVDDPMKEMVGQGS